MIWIQPSLKFFDSPRIFKTSKASFKLNKRSNDQQTITRGNIKVTNKKSRELRTRYLKEIQNRR